ncbi:MAG TPA: carboxypeptidase-like regulatory domain-containing protein, partial [Verrucomicrobiae bacterium]|nr:carboxypeptidase-like regulatory domain-containing protein [Verrucomicrobiae bacterium]
GAASADQPGGIVGSVFQVGSGRLMPGVLITISRVESHPLERVVKTDRNGHFADIGLRPGRYIVMATLPGQTLGCAIDDVYGGQTVQMRIGVGSPQPLCIGPRVHPSLVDPSATADVYRIF